jgi:hypothetical protein
MNKSKEYIKSVASVFNPSKKNGFYYAGMYDLLNREGVCFDSKRLTKKENEAVNDLFETFKLMNGTPQYKQCFYNAQMAICYDRSGLFSYSEGYAIDPEINIPIHHGFLTINNKVVDFTWRDKKGNFYIGENSGDYFGIKFSKNDILEAMLDTKMARSHLEGFWNKGLLFSKKFTNGKSYYATKK